MKQTTRAILMLGLCGTVAAAQDAAKKSADLTDPVEILKRADAACKAVNSVQYAASFEGSGTQERFVGKSSGTVTLKGRGAGGAAQYRYEAKLEKPGSNDVNDVTVGSDGKTHFLIDAKAKKAYEDINPAVVGTAGRAVLRGLTMAEYLHPEPFSDEINGKKQELKGTTKVGDEDCYEVNVEYGQAGMEATWFFSKKDFLPRRVDRRVQAPTGVKGGTQLIVTKLTVDPKLDKDPFKLVVPEGFTKTDGFAP
jgi:outer membrane lipoprotein-sorting protein